MARRLFVTFSLMNTPAGLSGSALEILPRREQPSRRLILAISPFKEDHIALRHILRDANWETLHCKTYREALAILGRAPVVLCDQQLPDGDWKDVLKQLNAISDPAALIVTSRLAHSPLWAEVLNLGAFDLLEKPFVAQEVREAISAAYHRREAERERRRYLQLQASVQ